MSMGQQSSMINKNQDEFQIELHLSEGSEKALSCLIVSINTLLNQQSKQTVRYFLRLTL